MSNCLFGTLKYLLTQDENFEFAGGIKPVLDKTVKEINYFRIPLPIDDVNVEPYELIEAHLSIYESMDPKKATLGAAHVTASFKLGNQKYRMHLFLDENEKLTCEPHWDRFEDGEFIKTSKPGEIDDLVYIMWQLGLPCFQQLRNKQNEAIRELSINYEKAETIAAASSKNFHQHKDEYLACIEATLAPVKVLTTLSNNIQWQRLIRHFDHLKRAVLQAQEPVVEAEHSDIQSTTSAEKPKAANQSRGRSRQKNRGKEKEIMVGALVATAQVDNEFESLLELYKIFVSTQEKTESNHLLLTLHHRLSRILDKNQKLTVEQINRLRQLECDLNKTAKISLQNALIKGDFSTARKMHEFFSLIGDDVLNAALITKNLELLAFLIDEINFPMESYAVTVKEKQYKNAMEYCYLNTDKSNHVSDVMELLVSHGVSLMHPVEPGWLPIAHFILSAEPRHPLMSVLDKNPDMTLNNKGFYQQLIRSCQRHLAKTELSTEDRALLTAQVKIYKRDLEKITVEQKLLLPRCQKAQQELVAHWKSLIRDESIEKLQKDPEIVAMHRVILEKSNSCVRTVRDFTQRHRGTTLNLSSIVENIFATLKEEKFKNWLESMVDACDHPDYFELKEDALKYLQQVSQLFDKTIKFVDLKRDLFKKQQIKGKINKKTKSLIQQVSELMKEIQEESQIFLPQTSNEKIKAEEILSQTLHNFQEHVRTMSEGLQKLQTALSNLNALTKEGVGTDEENESSEQYPASELLNKLGFMASSAATSSSSNSGKDLPPDCEFKQ